MSNYVGGLVFEGVEVAFRARRDAVFPEPLCSLIRGRLGWALQQRWCVTETLACDGCEASNLCRYTQIWRKPGLFYEGAHGGNGWHPFWLSGVPARRRVQKGERFRARLTMIGPARSQFMVFAEGLHTAVVEAGRGPGADEGPLVVEGAGQREPWTIGAQRRSNAWRIEALSPLMLGPVRPEDEAACPAAPWLVTLAHAAHRRLRGLAAGYGGGESIDGRLVLPDLTGVVVQGGRGLQGWKSSRWSRRQGRREPLAGLVGQARLRGEALVELSPLLEAAAVVGVGKKTTRGFGQVLVEALS